MSKNREPTRSRDLVWVVLRKYDILNNSGSVHCIDVCRTLDRAEELRESYEFDYKERNIVGFQFVVQSASYVDE